MEKEAFSWRLLFQIDTDDNVDLNWGDAGVCPFLFTKKIYVS
jgi:uncharacterized protein YwqG